jgi:hypothetical protein
MADRVTPPGGWTRVRVVQAIFFAVLALVGIYAWGLALHQFLHHHPLSGVMCVGVAALLYGGSLAWVRRHNIKRKQ